MSNLRELKIQLDLIDNASAGLEGVNTELDGMESTVGETRDGVSDLGHETKDFGHESKGTLEMVNTNWALLGGGIMAAGMALEGFVRGTQDMRYELGVAAINFGETTDSMIDTMAASTNATLSQDDYTKALSRLIQMQVDEMEVADELIRHFDVLADATGIDIVEGINIANTAFRVMGGELMDIEKYLDSFTWLSRHTTVNLSYFQRGLMEFGGELQEMGLEIDDIIILFGAMQEAGIEDREMMRQLRSAVNDSDGTLQDFHKTLGVTNEQIENQTRRLSEAEGMAQEYADTFADTRTLTQEIQSDLQDWNVRLGDVAGEHEWLSAAIIGVGGAIIGMWAVVKGVGLVQGFGAIVGGIVGKLAGLKGIAVGIGIVGAKFVAIGAVIGGALYGTYKLFTDFEGSVKGVIDFIFDTAESIRDFNWSIIPDTIGGAFNDAVEFVQNIDWVELGKDVVRGLISGVKGMFSNLGETATSIGQHFRDRFTDFWGIDSDSKLMLEYGKNIMGGLDTGMSKSAPERIPTPSVSVSPVMAGGGGMTFAPVINISGYTGDASELASKIDGRIRSTFGEFAEKYFASQRRRRPRKREEEVGE